MIAFGSAITKPEVYARCARVGIDRALEPGAKVFELDSKGSLFAGYNTILDQAAELDDLEALVLLHHDSEIVDADFCDRVRATLADPDVGLAGAAGAIGVRSIAWWEGSVTAANFLHRFDEMGGGEVQAMSWLWPEAPPYAHLGEVETLDGFLLVLPPWTVRNVRFDESLGSPLHGYDLDFCLQVRAAGRKVVTGDFRAIHHHALHAFADPEEWITAHMRIADKWEGKGLEPHPGSWKQRALLAEAQTHAARAVSHGKLLELDARTRHVDRAIEETTTSVSWKLAAPLRALARR